VVTDTDTLDILKELAEKGVVPDEGMERTTQEVGGNIVHLPDEELPVPMVETAVKGPGYTTVFNTETGLDSLVSNNMLPAQLKKRLPSGKRAFTIYDPGFRPPEGTLKCYMHPDHLLRKVCDEFGFVVCTKSNIASPYEVRQHMVHRHKQEWLAMEERRERIEREEGMDIQRGMLEAMRSNGSAVAPAPVQADESEPEPGPEPETRELYQRECKRCDHIVTAETEEGLSPKIGGHMRKAHPKGK